MALLFMLVFASFLSAPWSNAAVPAANVVIDTTPIQSAKPGSVQSAAASQVTAITQAAQIPALANDPTKDIPSIYLNFENASLASVLHYLGEQKKINIVPHKDLDGVKVSLSTRTPMTIAQAWDVLFTLLDINGFSLVLVNEMYRVVPAQANTQEVLPTYSSSNGIEPANLPNTDTIIRYIYFLKNMKSENVSKILGSMLDPKSIIFNQNLNALIIKDTALNIKTACSIIRELDLGCQGEDLAMVPLQFTSSDNVQKIFTDILGNTNDTGSDRIIRFSSLNQKDAMYFSNQAKIISEPIRNMIILLGTQKAVARIKEFIIKYIDIPIENADSRLHIKELRFSKAQEMQALLTEVIKPPKTATEKSLIVEGGFKVFEDVMIAAETQQENTPTSRGCGNRLIVAANRDDWQRIEALIDQLDKPQPQIALEVMIVDVSMNQIKGLGTQLYNLKGRPVMNGLNAEFLNLGPGADGVASRLGENLSSLPAIPAYLNLVKNEEEGASFLSLGRSGGEDIPSNIWGMIRATFNITNQQIITQPYIVANNNQECTVYVQNTKQVAGGLQVTNSVALVKQEPISAPTSVKLTPCINLSGNVDLTIDISADDFLEGSTTQPGDKITRKITTKTSMATGEVLVIGGLIKSKLSESLYKTPLLGDIPVIGALFKNKKKTKDESNLYVFIRPSIIKPRFEGTPDEYTQLKLDYAKYQIMKNDTYVNDKDPIQRFYFKPSNQSIQAKLDDATKGILRPIDNFTYGRSRPKTVSIDHDPYFKIAASIEKAKLQKRAMRSAPITV
jgi:general secretion pathway protein D